MVATWGKGKVKAVWMTFALLLCTTASAGIVVPPHGAGFARKSSVLEGLPRRYDWAA